MKHIKLFESFLGEAKIAWTKGKPFGTDDETGLYIVVFEEDGKLLEDRLVYFFYGVSRGDSVSFVYDPTTKQVYSYEIFEAGQDGYDAPEESDGMNLPYECEAGPKIISIHHAVMPKSESTKLIESYDKILEKNFEIESEDNY